MRFVHVVFLLMLVVVGANDASASTEQPHQEGYTAVEIGVIEDLMQGRQGEFLQETIDLLRRHFQKKQLALRLTRGTTAEIQNLIEHNRVDLFIAPSETYRRLLLSGCRDIAVTHATKTTNPNRAIGALFLTRLGEEPNVADVAACSKALRLYENIESSDIAIRGELVNHGLTGPQSADLVKGMRRQPATDKNLAEALEHLKQGSLDFLVLPVCRLERFCQNNVCRTEGLGVLWSKQDMDMACFHSTQLYPGIVLASMPSLTPYAHQEVLRTVYSMPSSNNGQSWHLASNFQTLDDTLRVLDDDAWTQVRQSFITRLLERWHDWIVLGACAVGLVVLYTIILQLMVRRKTRQLRLALVEQQQARREIELMSRRLERMRRLQTIGQMASLFAHELGQPLNAIGCYAHGIGKATEGWSKQKAVQTGLKGIEQQVGRASAIVQKVRDYVRSQSTRTNVLNLDLLIETAINNFKITSLGNIPIQLIRGEVDSDKYQVQGDPLELELVVTNLLRNAAQAQQTVKNPLIRVNLFVESGPGFMVTDNGNGLTEQKLAELIQIGESTRPEGLGLGLSIVRNLVSQHDGRLDFSLTKAGGLCVKVIFPVMENREDKS